MQMYVLQVQVLLIFGKPVVSLVCFASFIQAFSLNTKSDVKFFFLHIYFFVEDFGIY